MKLAILLPCYNEGTAIHDVVTGFRDALPDADVYVYDNGSSDDTAEQARAAGAFVRREDRQGKGYVVRRMFADVDADFYLMADGDGTYDTGAARELVHKLVDEDLDMVVGIRVPDDRKESYRPGHATGNRVLTGLVRLIFGHGFTDMLSGYRAMSRRFVKSFPALATGFETETEITIHALQLGLPCGEVPTRYAARAAGSTSKLNTWRDGVRILRVIVQFFKEVRPLLFFGILGSLLVLLSVGLAVPVVAEYLETGLVPRFPTAILSSAIMLSAFLCYACGIILDSVSRGRLERKRLAYLAQTRYDTPPS
jgi:glycosyltransferase involved in cell wall biosynthesis